MLHALLHAAGGALLGVFGGLVGIGLKMSILRTLAMCVLLTAGVLCISHGVSR